MAFGGFGGALSAKLIQQQVRQQLGLPPQGLGQSGSSSPRPRTGNAALDMQLADQNQAQNIFREIAAETRAVTGGGHSSRRISPYHNNYRPGVGNYHQMQFMLQIMMQTMMAMTQLSNGFSMFMGGPAPYPAYR